MWEISIRLLFISAFPETVALALLAFSIARIKFKPAPVLFIGAAEAFLMFLIRKFQIVFGLHTLIAIVALSGMLFLYKRANARMLIISSFISVLILCYLEFFSLVILNWLWPGYMQLAMHSEIDWAITSYPHTFIMLALSIYLSARNNKKSAGLPH